MSVVNDRGARSSSTMLPMHTDTLSDHDDGEERSDDEVVGSLNCCSCCGPTTRGGGRYRVVQGSGNVDVNKSWSHFRTSFITFILTSLLWYLSGRGHTYISNNTTVRLPALSSTLVNDSNNGSSIGCDCNDTIPLVNVVRSNEFPVSGSSSASFNNSSPFVITPAMVMGVGAPQQKVLELSLSLLAVDDEGHNGTLVAYSYFETPKARENLIFFLTVGVQPYLNSSNVHFLFVMMSHATIEFPAASNIFFHYRANFGMDICGWHETMVDPFMLNKTGHAVEKYRFIIWMNASVRGPFLPIGTPLASWLPYFLLQINKRDKLIGTSVNCYFPDGWKKLFLQSMFFAFEWRILPSMMKHTPCTPRKEMSVIEGELRFTPEIRGKYGFVPQQLSTRGVNYLDENDINQSCTYDWQNHKPASFAREGEGNYFGITYHPLELVFIKTNREMSPKIISLYSDWMLASANKLYSWRPKFVPLPLESSSSSSSTGASKSS